MLEPTHQQYIGLGDHQNRQEPKNKCRRKEAEMPKQSEASESEADKAEEVAFVAEREQFSVGKTFAF